jgi:hypothetical protein
MNNGTRREGTFSYWSCDGSTGGTAETFIAGTPRLGIIRLLQYRRDIRSQLDVGLRGALLSGALLTGMLRSEWTKKSCRWPGGRSNITREAPTWWTGFLPPCRPFVN